MRIDSYWSWEDQPAVLVNYENDNFGGLLLEDGSPNWSQVTEYDVVQWFKEGGDIPQPEFESRFGVIGEDLPPLPQL